MTDDVLLLCPYCKKVIHEKLSEIRYCPFCGKRLTFITKNVSDDDWNYMNPPVEEKGETNE